MPSAAVKFAGTDKSRLDIRLVPFGGSINGRDAAQEWFSAKSQLCLDWYPDRRPLLYHHGLDKDAGVKTVGYIDSITVKDDGAWAAAQLDKHNEYYDAIVGLIEKSALGASSGAMAHLVKVAKSGHIDQWPLCEGSLTPTPCEPLLATVDFATAKSHFKSIGIELDDSHAGIKAGGVAPTADLPDSYYLHADATKSVGRYRDDTGTVDASLLDAAVQEVDASDLTEEAKVKALSRARAVSREHGFTAVTTVVSTEPIKAVWSQSYVDSLPDNAFLYIEPSGKKDAGGRTEPRTHRHFAYKGNDGAVDLPHLKSVLTQIPDSSLPADIKERVVAKARRLAKANGIGDEGAKAYMKVFNKARIKVMGGGDDDGESEYEGSYEDLIDDLRDLLNPSDPWAESGYSSVICTYPTYFVCSKWVGGEQTYWRFPYEINDVGDPVLGSPIEVQQTYVPVKTAISTGPLALDAMKTAAAATALVRRTQDLYKRREEEGRPLSPAITTELSGTSGAFKRLASEIDDFLETTDRKAQEAAKAAFFDSPDGRAMRLRVLELAVPTPA